MSFNEVCSKARLASLPPSENYDDSYASDDDSDDIYDGGDDDNWQIVSVIDN